MNADTPPYYEIEIGVASLNQAEWVATWIESLFAAGGR